MTTAEALCATLIAVMGIIALAVTLAALLLAGATLARRLRDRSPAHPPSG